jgi:hypothetical protein
MKKWVLILLAAMLLAGCAAKTEGKETGGAEAPAVRCTEAPADLKHPYFKVTDDKFEYPIYAFMDKEGMIRYRVYAEIGDKAGFLNAIFDVGAEPEFDEKGEPILVRPHAVGDADGGFTDDTDNLYAGLYKDMHYPTGDVPGAVPVRLALSEDGTMREMYFVFPNGYTVLVQSDPLN